MNRRRNRRILELQDQLLSGKMTRREFIRFATLLGVSIPAASALAACGQQAAPVAEATATPVPATATPASAIKRGGSLKVASYGIGRVDHPARYSWVSHSQSTRQVAEYLTYIDENNITHPYLLEEMGGQRRPQDLDANRSQRA